MKKLALLLSLVAAAPVFAAPASPPGSPATTPQGELPYSELMQKAEDLLKPQGPNNTRFDTAAIVVFHRAARVAPDDDKKAEALLRAGELEELIKQYPSALESYNQAFALPKLSAPQKLRVQFAITYAKFKQAENKGILTVESDSLRAPLESALASPELPQTARIKGLEAVARLHIARNRFAEAAAEYQKLLAQPKLAADQKALHIARILVELGKATPTPGVIEAANALFPQHLANLKGDKEIIAARQQWANLLKTQNDKAGAVKQLHFIADNTEYDSGQRVPVLRQISQLQRESKNFPAALAAADQIGALGQTVWIQINYRSDRAATFMAQNDEPKTRAEWQALIATPQVTPETQATSYQRIAESFKRERLALKEKSREATLLEGEKRALEAAWNTNGARMETRQAALLDRAQIEVDAGKLEAASTLLLDAVKASEAFTDDAQATNGLKRGLYLALSSIYRVEKSFAKAIAALVATHSFSMWGDNVAGQNALAVMQEAYTAKDWDSSRAILLSLKTVWGLPEKAYLYNLVQVEVEAKQWDAAKKALDAFDKQAPTAEETTAVARLRALIPAAP